MLADPQVLPVMLAICVGVVVLGRAIQPLLGSMGALVGLIGTAMALIAAIVALCALIFAGLADWAGWSQASAPGQIRFTLLAVGAAMIGTLIVVALSARRLHRRKRFERGPFWRD